MALRDFGDIAPNIAVADDADLVSGGWLAEARAALADTGAVLLRGRIAGDDAAATALSLVSPDLLDDAFWSTPRSKVTGKTLTATEFPKEKTIQLHSEMSYMTTWPRYVAFHSLDVADEGGETTICDIDAVSTDLGNALDPFERKGVIYRRTFQKGVDIPWQRAFQTTDRRDVEKIGKRFGMKVEWLPGDALATAHTAQGAIRSEDGRPIYFNQAHLFHASLLDPKLREGLEKLHGPGRLPRDATFGDNSPIPTSQMEEVRCIFEGHQTGMRWRAGDILILDNMRHAHGRAPFQGKRKVHVAMADETTDRLRRPLAADGRAALQPARSSGLFHTLFGRARN